MVRFIKYPLTNIVAHSSVLIPVAGVFGVTSGILWMVVASNRPQSNRFITEREKNYITLALENQNLGVKKVSLFSKQSVKIYCRVVAL